MSDKKKALVIEVEGIDGCGKTTAYNFLCDQLEAKGLKVLRTREVGSPHVPLAPELRKMILNPDIKLNGAAMEFIFAAMRVMNQDFYASVADQYDYIVSDRGWLSHLAYTDHNVSAQFTHDFYNSVVRSITKLPDLILYLDIDPEVALKRRKNRGETEDAIEKKGHDFQKNVAKSFTKHIFNSRLVARTYNIDANGTKEDVQAQLIDVVTKLTSEETDAGQQAASSSGS